MSALPTPPAEAAWMSDVIGAEATLRLVEQRGGQALYIPHEVNQASPLAQLLGLDAARALAGAFGGEHRKIPLLRWWRVRVEKARGLTDRAIAAKLVMTEDHVSRLLRARAPAPADTLPKSTSQLNLFGT